LNKRIEYLHLYHTLFGSILAYFLTVFLIQFKMHFTLCATLCVIQTDILNGIELLMVFVAGLVQLRVITIKFADFEKK
jgi:ABC-type spermidine/putrescine transport system permease subunit II